MSGLVVLPDNLEGEFSSAEIAGLSRGQSVTLDAGQLSHSSCENGGFRIGELFLLNGECYSGTLLRNMPEGSGKYVWSDGCAYEGEWRRGMKHGIGKLLWPSGAVYEGEFSGGYMHGTGTYIGSGNITYKGRWRFNIKHGLGYQSYPNGDTFEGSWIQGVIEGHGKYIWANGNVYIGNMKGGKMYGKGTLTWKSGDSYEGSWLNGLMHGFGVYTWEDGGYYVGTWTRGLKDGKGAFYPKGGKLPATQELYFTALRKRGLLPDLRKQNNRSHIHQATSVDMGSTKVHESSHRSTEKMSKGSLLNLGQSQSKNVALERRWSLEVAIERVIGNDMSLSTGESAVECTEKEAEENVPILEREYMQGVLISELVINNNFSPLSRKARRRQRKLAKEIKRPGETIIKGHRSYDLMLSLQLGIR